METDLKDRETVGVQDAVLLEDFTNESVFIDNLEKRYKRNLIYTYIGNVLISVNPYHLLDIYRPQDVNSYINTNYFEAAPHIFAVTDNAFRALDQGNDQCILISGESGAGKTEASKKVLQFISQVSGNGEIDKIQNKLLLSNPILEAFGNAKTNRNDNSSRFGKYMDIQFYTRSPEGGNILNYLLEKSRVVNQVFGERNFHIFYQLLAGADDELLGKLLLERGLEKYKYLTNGSKANDPTLKDKANYLEVTEALHTLSFESKEIEEIFSIVSGILHLGNVEFTQDNGIAKFILPEVLKKVSKVWGISLEVLEKCLRHHSRETRRELVVTPLNKELAASARDALAKATYDRLFSWLVQQLNRSLKSTSSRKLNVIGILDIYGFEIFKTNSFEQLCINYCNEKIHQLFIDLTLKSEQEEYKNEGIEWVKIEYFDNSTICELIEGNHKGLIAFMDEECLLPGEHTDKSLLIKLNKELSKHNHYISHQKADTQLQKKMQRNEFQIKHYAGDVIYKIDGFIDKNNDLLYRDLREAMATSSNSIIKSIYPEEEYKDNKRPETVITKFKQSLKNLINILRNKEPSYIRCIKPNASKQAHNFDRSLVKVQVKYLGLMENLRVRRAGFAYRRVYEQFLKRYKSLCKDTWPSFKGDPKQGVELIVKALQYKPDEYQMGKTKIFIRHPNTLFHTEDLYQQRRHELATMIKAHYKGMVQRRKYKQTRKYIIIVQKCVRKFLAVRMAARKRKAINSIRGFIKGFITRNGPPTDENKAFAAIAKVQWLKRLATSLPKSVLDKSWPVCPYICKEASEMLKGMYMNHMARRYRSNITPERKKMFELKLVAWELFKGKKTSYLQSVPQPFASRRLSPEQEPAINDFAAKLIGEKEIYSTLVTKYDRHGYKERSRIIFITNQNFYILEWKNSSSVKIKHTLPLNSLTFSLTSQNDRMLLVNIPEDLVKKEKGDIILQFPNVIEVMAHVVHTSKKNDSIKIMDKSPMQHKMKGKQGLIDFTIGNPERMLKDKNGHLLVVATP